MGISASALRADIYRMLDAALESGEPIIIERNGRELRIIPVDPPSKLGRLTPRPDFVVGDPLDLAEIDWSDEWHPDPA